MTDVFVSYKREDKPKAKAVAEALARRGLDVWWDVDLLPGNRFAEEIEAVLHRATVAVVLWSARSITSDYVRDEAELAKNRGILVPARLDASQPPLGFRGVHTEDLAGWAGDAESPLLTPLIEAVAARAGKAEAPVSDAEVQAHLGSGNEEATFWQAISNVQPQSAAEYRLYQQRYPNGLFTELAELRIATLETPAKPSRQPTKAIAAATGLVVLVGGVFGLVTQWPDVKTVLITEWQQMTAAVAAWWNRPLADLAVFTDTLDDGSPCSFCPEMVLIPAGTFWMGSAEGEGSTDERPMHRVDLARFAIGRYEVTFAEYDACIDAGDCKRRRDDSGWGRGRRPVIDVSWDDAQTYVRWLTQVTGQPYRLPTEAEWEFAARAGTTTAFAFGDEITSSQANFGRNLGKTWEVGSGARNDWGLDDMHGNLFEWVEDCWHRTYDGAPSDGRAWLEGNDGGCSLRVLRGGSWSDTPDFLRSAYRSRDVRDYRNDGIGFRVARTLTP